MCFNAKLKILEHRQQRIAEVRAKYEWLMKELETTKQYLMLDPNKWLSECKAHHCDSQVHPLNRPGRGTQMLSEPHLCPSAGGSFPELDPTLLGADGEEGAAGGDHGSCRIISCVSQSRSSENEIFFSPPACGGQSPRHEGYITNLLPGHKITLHI